MQEAFRELISDRVYAREALGVDEKYLANLITLAMFTIIASIFIYKLRTEVIGIIKDS